MRLRFEHDVYYIENWSLWFDFKILVMTFIGLDQQERLLTRSG